MVKIVPVDNPSDPRIAGFRDLNHAEKRRDHEGPDGVVIGEGSFVIDRMLDSYCPPTQFLGTDVGLDRLIAMPDYARIANNTVFYKASADVISECVGFHFNRHIFALAPRPTPRSVSDVLSHEPRTLVALEGLNDHASIGSIFRNAAALNVGGVLIGAGCADPLYRRSVRVSMGHVLRVPFAVCEGGPNDWQEQTFEQLHAAGYRILALTPAHDAQFLSNAADGDKVAFLVGAEGPGLRRKTMRLADARVQIPMQLGVDSLNGATSAAVAFYERIRN